MVTIRNAIVLVAATASLGCPRVPPAAARSEIEAINARVAHWYATGNVDSIAQVFAPDAQVLTPNRAPITGRDSIRAQVQQMIANTKWDVALATESVETSGPLAVERGQYRITIWTDAAPAPLATDHGQRLVAWRRIDDEWKIAFDMSGTDVPRRLTAQRP